MALTSATRCSQRSCARAACGLQVGGRVRRRAFGLQAREQRREPARLVFAAGTRGCGAAALRDGRSVPAHAGTAAVRQRGLQRGGVGAVVGRPHDLRQSMGGLAQAGDAGLADAGRHALDVACVGQYGWLGRVGMGVGIRGHEGVGAVAAGWRAGPDNRS